LTPVPVPAASDTCAIIEKFRRTALASVPRLNEFPPDCLSFRMFISACARRIEAIVVGLGMTLPTLPSDADWPGSRDHTLSPRVV
jgi:hypothetical protein